VAQPGLTRSRGRGALLGFAAAVGAPVMLAYDPASGGTVPFSRSQGFRDARRFATAYVACAAVAALVARVVERLPDKVPGALPREGSVAYMRTDLDLALTPLLAGGSLEHTRGVLTALRARGYDVQTWSTGPMAGVEAQPLPVVLRPNMGWEIAELASGLIQAATARGRRRPSAFIYQRYSANNLAGVIASRLHGVPLVLEANASEVAWRTEWSSLTHPRLARATERLVLGRSDVIAAVSANAARGLIEAGADPSRTHVVPNGVNVDRFRAPARVQLPFDSGSFVVGFAGLFYPWHGVRFLSEGFVELHRRRPNSRLLLVGDGEERTLAQSILEIGGASDAARVTGVVPAAEVPGYLAATDVLVCPHARNDGFIGSPIKLFEYMAAGRAIVATNVGQIGEVLEHRRTALVVAPDDPAALADALTELHDDKALRERLGEAARREAELQHSWDARLAKLLEGPG
ncbi:MAG: hypothetical protein QOE64_1942, partial [Frankiales bacterium]|nr:hypothetical protein [Frankiales bacterium]